MLEGREKIINWLNKTEQKNKVQELKLHQLHLWPILRWAFFKEIVNREGYVKKTDGHSKLSQVLKLKYDNILENIRGLLGYMKLRFGSVSQAEVIFAGSHTHRVYYKSKFINRYYDPISNYFKQEKIDFVNADYSVKNKKDYTFKGNHFPLTSVYYFYKRTHKRKGISESLDNIAMLQSIITEYNLTFGVQFNKKAFYKKVGAVLDWADIYELLIKGTRARLCFALCYYNEAMYGLNLAAYRRQVTSVDMQHGPQGLLHAAYTGFFNIPENGYSCLPDYFWVWDKMSFDNLQNRLENTSFHKVLIGGNPWIYFLENEQEELKVLNNNKILLFSLQPILPFLPEILLEALKKTPKGYIWWLRMHPRMTKKDVLEVKSTIEKRGLSHLVNFNDATELPLPLVLKHSFVHISKSSGCVLEAAMMGTPNIIVDPLGGVYFSDLIDQRMNFKQTEGNIWPLIESLEGRKRTTLNNNMIPTLEMLLKN